MGLGKSVGDILQYCGVLGEYETVLGTQGRHQPERVDGTKVRAVVLHHFGLRIDLEVIGRRAGFIEGDPRGERAGERREIQVHCGLHH
jgi:hypothetical protein